jgi:LysR family transcriptional regulator for metE and metH
MDLEVRYLRLVQAIADEGTMTRAAERLHLTQPALSHQLAAIERRLGGPLFLRLRRRMVPTGAGERLLVAARQVLCELERAEEEIRRSTSGRRGLLRLATECSTVYRWLPARLRLLRRRHPDLEIQVAAEATSRPLAALLDGRLDLAIVRDPPADRRLRAEALFADEMVAVLAAGHRLARRRFLGAEDFAAEHLIVYSSPKEEDFAFSDLLLPARVLPARVSQVQFSQAIVELVKAGLGVSVAPRWTVAEEVSAGAVAAVALTSRGIFRHWHAATLAAAPAPPYLREFVELLAALPVPVGRTAAERSLVRRALLRPVRAGSRR